MKGRTYILVRVIADAVLFAAAYLSPWWFGAVLLIFLSVVFPWYWEGMIWGLCRDAVYGAPPTFAALMYPYSFFALLIIFLMSFIKSRSNLTSIVGSWWFVLPSKSP